MPPSMAQRVQTGSQYSGLLLDLISCKTTAHMVLMGAGTMTRLDACF